MNWTVKAPAIAEWQAPSGDLYKIHTLPTISKLGSGIQGRNLWSVQLIVTKNDRNINDATFETWEDALAAIQKVEPSAPNMDTLDVIH